MYIALFATRFLSVVSDSVSASVFFFFIITSIILWSLIFVGVFCWRCWFLLPKPRRFDRAKASQVNLGQLSLVRIYVWMSECLDRILLIRILAHLNFLHDQGLREIRRSADHVNFYGHHRSSLVSDVIRHLSGTVRGSPSRFFCMLPSNLLFYPWNAK